MEIPLVGWMFTITNKEKPTKDETFAAKEKLDTVAAAEDNKVILKRERSNPHDDGAIRVDCDEIHLGYLPKSFRNKDLVLKTLDSRYSSKITGRLVKEKKEFAGARRAYFIEFDENKHCRFNMTRSSLSRLHI